MRGSAAGGGHRCPVERPTQDAQLPQQGWPGAGRETSRDRRRVAENLGNEGVGKSEGANESCRSVEEGLTEIKTTQRDRQ
jgi:hypothetical protein